MLPVKRAHRAALYLPTVVLLLVIGVSVASFPRLGTEQATACGQCHISPSGGGARTEFGNHAVALNELCLPPTKHYALERYQSPRIGNALLIGFDSRYLVFDDLSTFRMQTDFYATVEPFTGFMYHLRFSEFDIAESYALLSFNDQAVYMRAGRFFPTFGLRNADHTSFNRVRTGHGPLAYLDGVAVGGNSLGGHWAIEAFDDNGQGVYGAHYQYFGYSGALSYTAGASLRYSELVGGSTLSHPHARAIFTGLSYDRFTALGEVDLSGRRSDTLIVYGSLTTRLEYGLYLIGEYNFFDGDRDRKSGVDELIRASLEIYPIAFVSVRPSLTFHSRGRQAGEKDFFVQFHIGY